VPHVVGMTRWIVSVCGAGLALGCATLSESDRRLEYGALDSDAMGERMRYSVYTPPGFSAQERLPLVVFLHGGGDGPEAFDLARIGQTLDEAVARGEVPRAVIVLPQGNLGFWANWYDGSHHYQDWVIEDLMPVVMRRYHTQGCPEGCHIMGVSMGGAGTLRFVLNRPELFASATIISGPILSTEQMQSFVRNPLLVPLIPTGRIWGPADEVERIERDDPYLRWDDPGDLGQMSLMLAWGDEDRGQIQETSAAFSRHLSEHGIEHERLVYDGNHSWVSWTPVIQEALRRQLWSDRRASRDTPESLARSAARGSPAPRTGGSNSASPPAPRSGTDAS